LFKQFSFPGGIPSHCSPDTPGSMHEGGELGYSLSHAFGAVLDKPNLIVACVVGDGEAEVSASRKAFFGPSRFSERINVLTFYCLQPITDWTPRYSVAQQQIFKP
jgi:phosphoketolase